MTRRRKAKASRELLAGGKRKGTEMVLTIDAELLGILDAVRSDVEELSGVVLTRRQALEGLLRKVWRQRLVEASAMTVGAHLKGGGT